MKKFKVIAQGGYFIPGIRKKVKFGDVFEVEDKFYDIVKRCRILEELEVKNGSNRKQ